MAYDKAAHHRGAYDKAAHHRGAYDKTSRALNRASTLNPYTICWRCGRTLAQHPPHRNGKPQRWTTGHLDPTKGHLDTARHHGALIVLIDGRPCSPEASRCNYSNDNKPYHQRVVAEPRGERW